MDDRRTEGHDHTPFGGSFLDAFRSPPYPFPDIPPYNVKTLHFHGGTTTEDTQHAWGYTFTTVVLHDGLGDAGTMRGLGLIYVPSRPAYYPFTRARDKMRSNLVSYGGQGGFTFRRVRVSVQAGVPRNA